MSAAEELRAAARLMRERAEAATAGDWIQNGFEYDDVADSFTYDVAPASDPVISLAYTDALGNAEHIASWHPAVALAVADWLEAVADRHDELLDTFAPGSRAGLVTARENVTAWEQALTVARTYLGAT